MPWTRISFAALALATPIIASVPAEAATGTGNAPSFDCSKDQNAVLALICATPLLAELDRKLAIAYSNATAKSSSPQELRDQQRAWIKARNNSEPDISKLKRMYSERIATLNNLSAPPVETTGSNKREGHLTRSTSESGYWLVVLVYINDLGNVRLQPGFTPFEHVHPPEAKAGCDAIAKSAASSHAFVVTNPYAKLQYQCWTDKKFGVVSGWLTRCRVFSVGCDEIANVILEPM